MNKWRKLRDLNRLAFHAGIAPFGAAVATYLWAILLGDGEWLFWQYWSAFTDAAFYGGLVYSFLAGLFWLGIKCTDSVFEAIHKSGYAAGLAENRSDGIRTGRREGMVTVLTESWRLADTADTKAVIRQVANNHDIDLPAIVGGFSGTVHVRVLSPWDVLWRRLADATDELRQRFDVDDFDDEVDRMLRSAIGIAVAELKKEIDQIKTLNPPRARQLN